MIRRLTFLLFILSMSWLSGHAQKEGNIWCFPDHSGINFNDTSNLITFSSAIGPNFGSPLQNQSTIADSSGNLFCYTSATTFAFNGLYVFDRNHNVMPNGSRLQGHPTFSSLLLPFPGIDSLICLLHFGRDSINTNYFRLLFSIINKNLNSGFGDVIIRDSLIYYGQLTSDKLAAVKHANGRDWWVFTYDYNSGSYVYFILTPNGVSHIGTQNIGSNANDLFYGKLLFSNDGTKMMGVGDIGHIDVFDFDRCSGLLSNYRDIGEHLSSEAYQYANAAFSPNGNIIYVSPFNLTKNFYQFNLNAPNITASKILLNTYPDTGMVQWTTYQWHNLAPDGKIYIPITTNYQGPNTNTFFTQHLDVIEYPDSVGAACHYIRQSFDLGGHFVGGCLPNMPYYGLNAMTGSICDSLTGLKSICETENGTEVFPNPSSGIFSLRLKEVNDKIVLVSVSNVLGNEVFRSKNIFYSIDISNKATGVYFVKVLTQKKENFSVKLIKQ